MAKRYQYKYKEIDTLNLTLLNELGDEGWLLIMRKDNYCLFVKEYTNRKSASNKFTNDELDQIKVIINYFNKILNKNIKYDNKNAQKLIGGLIRRGYNKNDFIKVITNKSIQWQNTDNSIYLRIETLFGNKFESYLNEKNKSSNVQIHLQDENSIKEELMLRKKNYEDYETIG